MLHCRQCKEEGSVISERHPNPRKCGFDENGFFTNDNYCCATLHRLTGVLHNPPKHLNVQSMFTEDEWVHTCPIELERVFGPDGTEYVPISLVVHQYKSRGRITGVWVVVDGGRPPIPATEACVLDVIRQADPSFKEA